MPRRAPRSARPPVLAALTPILVIATACEPGSEFAEAEVEMTSRSLARTAAAHRHAPDTTPHDATAPLPRQAVTCGSALRCTPEDFSGRVFSGGAMWGELGPDAFNITMIGADDEVLLDPSHGIGGTQTFSLLDQTVLPGRYVVPDRTPASPEVTRVEFNYDYLDATLTLEGALAGQWTLRTVFTDEATAEDVEGTMLRGDKLVRGPDHATFQWCDASTCGPTRDATTDVQQEASIANYVFPGQGNPAYVPFVVTLDPPTQVSAAALAEGGQRWTLDFEMTEVLAFDAAPNTLQSAAQLAAAFHFAFEGDRGTGITARLEIEDDPEHGAAPFEPEPEPEPADSTAPTGTQESSP